MKNSKKRIFRASISFLLVLCMMFGFTATALAANDEPFHTPDASVAAGVKDINNDGMITYVSFGDSVTNGYGMPGYRFESGRNTLGFYREVETSYPVMIRDDLIEKFGEEKVDLRQMAISGYRMNDLHKMLDEDGSYTVEPYDAFCNWNPRLVREYLKAADAGESDNWVRDKYSSTYGSDDNIRANADNVIKQEYRDAVKAADLITIDLGTNNFGTFVTNTVQYILGLSSKPVEVDFSCYVDENTAKSLDAMIDGMVASIAGTTEGQGFQLVRTLARCLMAGYLGFTENFDGAIAEIYRLNPDVEVVVIDMYTMITGVDLTGNALGANLDLDELYDMFIDMANLYTRELSPYAHKVTHATLNGAPELFIDYFADYPDNNYPDSQFLHPTAEILMDELVMEMMGYDPDEPAHRSEFQAKILDGIETLDSYVFNLQNTIDEQVITGIVDPMIKKNLEEPVALVNKAIDGVKQAKEAVATAQEGVETATAAVDAAIKGVIAATEAVKKAQQGVQTATEAVNTAVEGVAAASSLLTALAEYLPAIKAVQSAGMIPASLIKGQLDKFRGELAEAGLGHVSDDDLVAEVIKLADIYDEANTKPAIIEIIRFKLVNTLDENGDHVYTEEKAAETANLAWEINEIVDLSGEEAAIKFAIQTQVTKELKTELGVSSDEDAAILIYQLGTMDETAAIQKVIELKLTPEILELLGTNDKPTAAATVYDLGTLGQTDKPAAIKKGIAPQIPSKILEMLKMDRTEAAGFVYTIGSMEDTDAAVKAVLVQVLGAETTADLALQLYSVYAGAMAQGADDAAARDATVIVAMKTQMPDMFGADDGLAEAVYAIYKDIVNKTEKATYEQKQLAYVTLMTGQSVGSFTIDAALANAIFNCYAGRKEADGTIVNLDGQWNDADVKTVILFFMVYLKIADNAGAAADLYNQYLMYKNLPTTLAKVAKCKTIYFDALLAAAGGSSDTDDMLSGMADKFMNGTLSLDEPKESDYEDEAAYNEAFNAYMSDSALATLYFRFMCQDGVFTHPSDDGQKMLYQAASAAIKNLNHPEADSELDASKVLILGDNIAAAENSYATKLQELLDSDSKVTNISYDGFRINEVRALLDSTYTGDAYTTTVFGNNKDALSSAYQNAVKDNDTIVLDLGAMNMGFLAPQLQKYMESNGTQTYPMKFADIDIMDTGYLGTRADELLKMFEGAFTGENANVSVGTLMLAFKTYGYGYTTFVDCLDATVNTIKELNPDADIILLGNYNLLGGVYFEQDGMYLAMGDFIGHALKLMSQHMELYAEMTADVSYVDISGTENGITEPFNMPQVGFAAAFARALPTSAGHEYIAKQLGCFLGGHVPANADAITWSWNDDYTATVTFTCTSCNEEVTDDAVITSETEKATCTEPGSSTYTASYKSYTCSETKSVDHPATGHAYKEGTWTWAEDYSTATLKMVCENDTTHSETINAEITSKTNEATCTEAGSTTYTAAAEFGEETYTDTKTSVIPATGHDHKAVVTDPTCTEAGYTTYTCECGDTYIDDETPALGHKFATTPGTHECENGCGLVKTIIAVEEGQIDIETTEENVEFNVDPVPESDEQYVLIQEDFSTDKETEREVINVFDITMTKNDVAVVQPDGSVKVKLPGDWSKHATYKVYRLNDDGTYTDMKAERQGSHLVFNTNHFSLYIVIGESQHTHDYTPNVTAATCNKGGYTTYTCEACGDSYTGDETPATGIHIYGEDHKCTTCGEVDPDAHPECHYEAAETLTSGKAYGLKLGGTKVGTYTFTQVDKGWTIQNAEGKYLAISNKALTYSDSAFTWTWSNNRFSASVKSSSNNWFGNIFGNLFGSSSTYYLVASGDAPAVSTSNSGADASFFTVHSDLNHAFDEGTVTAPTCEAGGYTTFTCQRCGYSYTGNPTAATGHKWDNGAVTAPTCTEGGYTTYTCGTCGDVRTEDVVAALGHDYTTVVTAPTCTEKGYTTHTCSRCPDKYVDSYVDATGHNYDENGICGTCGDDKNVPQGPEAGECTYCEDAALTSGQTYVLSLGGTEVGTYTFQQVNNGWTIQNAEGKYLAISNKALTYSDSAFTWTWSNNRFSASVKSSSGSWFDNLFGRSTTYYLVASGNAPAVSTSNSGATATFCVKKTAENHDYDSGVVTAPTCTTGGGTVYTCKRCGHTSTADTTEALGHDYTEVVTAPTCTEKGYTTHTCSRCRDSYKDTYVDATGHDFDENGDCKNCPANNRAPECEYMAEKSLASGNTYLMTLGGTEVGTYTFQQVNDGWTIKNADGKYLALSNKALTTSDSAFTWTWSNNRFSASVKSSSGSWFDNLFGRSTTYYLVASGNAPAVSTSNSGATAKFYQEATGEHVFGDPVADNGSHKVTCINCGYEVKTPCTDEECSICHPKATVDISVEITSKTSGGSWWESLFGGSSGKTTYTATIKAVPHNTEIKSIQYSTDGSTWIEGSSFTSNSKITHFVFQVWTTCGIHHYCTYDNGDIIYG